MEMKMEMKLNDVMYIRFSLMVSEIWEYQCYFPWVTMLISCEMVSNKEKMLSLAVCLMWKWWNVCNWEMRMFFIWIAWINVCYIWQL